MIVDFPQTRQPCVTATAGPAQSLTWKGGENGNKGLSTVFRDVQVVFIDSGYGHAGDSFALSEAIPGMHPANPAEAHPGTSLAVGVRSALEVDFEDMAVSTVAP